MSTATVAFPTEPLLEDSVIFSTNQTYTNGEVLTTDIVNQILASTRFVVDRPPVFLGIAEIPDMKGGKIYAVSLPAQTSPQIVEAAKKFQPALPASLVEQGYNNLFVIRNGLGALLFH